MLALALLTLAARPACARACCAAFAAFIAAQPALLYAFLLQGQIKEVLAAYCVALLATLVLVYARTFTLGWRTVLPLAVAGAAGMAATGVGFGAWLGPAALLALLVLARASWAGERRRILVQGGAFAVALIVLALPSFLGMRVYFQSVSNLISNEVPLGSLRAPLSALQTAGIWWSGDYRLPIQDSANLNLALIGMVAAGVVLTAEWALRRRAWPAIVYFLVAVPGCLVLAHQGTPWIDVKAMIIAAPLVLLLALVGGVTVLAETPARIAGLVLAAAIRSGCWRPTRSCTTAPRSRRRRATRSSSGSASASPARARRCGPTSTTTRCTSPGAWIRTHPATPGPCARTGSTRRTAVSYGVSLRLDQLSPAYIEQYPTLLVQRSAFESRPPANFRRVYQGRYYEVWKRGKGRVLEHLGAGGKWAPAGNVSCADVRRLANVARREGATLAVSAAPEITIAPVAHLPIPKDWIRSPGDDQVIGTAGQGRLNTTIVAPRAGEYDLWLAGSFTRMVRVSVDGRQVASLVNDVKYEGLAQVVARVRLEAGLHDLQIDRAGGNLAPGNGAGGAIGPAALTPAGARPVVRALAPDDYREACGRPVDWVEVVRGVPFT